MRLIGSVYTPQAVAHLIQLLEQNNIPHNIEMQVVTDWGSVNYGDRSWLVWILNEEDLPRAQELYEKLIQDQYAFVALPQEKQIVPEKKLDTAPVKIITKCILFLCLLCFAGSYFLTAPQARGELFATPLIPTDPLKQTLLYDFPKQYALINQLLEKANLLSPASEDELQKAAMQPQNSALVKQINETAVWPGFYSIFIDALRGKSWQPALSIPRFEKIQEGEIWRLITPIFLHQNLIHLLFNLLWVYLLGRQLETGLGPLRYILFCLIVAAVSNTAQYLMTGPSFLGISGLICGMVTYIWLRPQVAENKEGYFLAPGVFKSLALFVGILASIQLLSFFFEATSNVSFPLSIANTAHLMGALTGAILALYFPPRQEKVLIS